MAEIEQNQIHEGLYRSLREIGLTEHESKLYMATLSRGSSLVSRLAKELAVTRPNLYKIANSLQKKGIGMFSKEEGYNRRFMVVSPSEIFALLDTKRSKIDDTSKVMSQALPELMSLYRQGEAPTKINIIRGVRRDLVSAFGAMYDEAKDEVLFMGSSEDLNAFLTVSEIEFQIKKRVSKNIRLKLLAFPSSYVTELKIRDEKELRETRLIKSLKHFQTSFYIYSNKMLLWQPKAPLVAIIEDEYLINMYRSIFDHLWSEAE